MQIDRIICLSVFVLVGATMAAFSPEGLFHRDMAEVSGCIRDTAGGGTIYDFSQGEIIDGNVRMIYGERDSTANVTFLQTRYNLMGSPDGTRMLVSEESRLKSIIFENPLSLKATDSAVAFKASGFYCRVTPIKTDGFYSFSTSRCGVSLTPGDTLPDVTKMTLNLRYKGNVGFEADDRVDADSMPTFAISKSAFIADGDNIPCAVIIDERIYNSEGVEIGKTARYFADVMTVIPNKRKSIENPSDDNGDISMTVSYSSGAIYISAQGSPADGIVAIMDKAGNIYRSSAMAVGNDTVIDVSGLPFGQYIVCLSSESRAISIKELVYIR